jgi:hypothetical protein
MYKKKFEASNILCDVTLMLVLNTGCGPMNNAAGTQYTQSVNKLLCSRRAVVTRVT